mmetsp:Transcript_30778/g.94322  ORF Transcript_30778/g.94322 Transcript_30778/m.94322 type:complete len:223 (+) Transcript_30778:321-989(+)
MPQNLCQSRSERRWAKRHPRKARAPLTLMQAEERLRRTSRRSLRDRAPEKRTRSAPIVCVPSSSAWKVARRRGARRMRPAVRFRAAVPLPKKLLTTRPSRRLQVARLRKRWNRTLPQSPRLEQMMRRSLLRRRRPLRPERQARVPPLLKQIRRRRWPRRRQTLISLRLLLRSISYSAHRGPPRLQLEKQSALFFPPAGQSVAWASCVSSSPRMQQGRANHGW